MTEGTFTAAAKKLQLTTSNVSRRVTRLEEAFGVQLLHRSTRSQSLTAAGEAFFERAYHSVRELGEAKADLLRFVAEPKGPLRVSIPAGFNQAAFGFFAEFLKRFPEVRLHLDESEQGLPDRGVDVAFTRARPPQGMESTLLTESRLVIVASRQYLEAHGTVDTPEDLKDFACIGFERQQVDGWVLLGKDKKRYEVTMECRLSSPNIHTVRLMAEAGVGLAILPETFVGKELVRVLPDFTAGCLELWLCYPQGEIRVPSFTALTELARSWEWKHLC